MFHLPTMLSAPLRAAILVLIWAASAHAHTLHVNDDATLGGDGYATAGGLSEHLYVSAPQAREDASDDDDDGDDDDDDNKNERLKNKIRHHLKHEYHRYRDKYRAANSRAQLKIWAQPSLVTGTVSRIDCNLRLPF